MPKKAITSPKAKAIGPYSAAVESRRPRVRLRPDSRSTPPPASWSRATSPRRPRQSLENLKTILAAAGLGFAHVVKTTIFLTSMGDFAAVNEVYKTYVGEPYPGALHHRGGGAAHGRQGRDRDDRLAQRRLTRNQPAG